MSLAVQVGYLLTIMAAVLSYFYLLRLCLRQRNQASARYVMYSVFAALAVLVCWLGVSLAPNEEVAFFWARFRPAILSIMPLSFLAWLLYNIHQRRWLQWPYAIVLFIIPTINFALAIFAPHSPLVFREVSYIHYDLITVEITRLGAWNSISNIIFMLLNVMALTAFVLRARRVVDPLNAQSAWILGGAILSYSLTSFNVWGILPPGAPNPTPVGFLLGSIFIAIGLRTYPLVDFAPIAHGLVFQNMAEAAIVLNEGGRIVDLNHKAAGLFPPDPDPIGQPLSQFPALAESEQQATHGGEAALNERVFAVSVAPVYAPHGPKPIGRVLTLTDISERKKAELERERLLSTLDAYARTVAHDLKNPVSVITGYQDLMRKALQGDAPIEKTLLDRYLQRAAESTAKMESIIDSLLLLATLRQDDSLALQVVEMPSIVGRVLDRLELGIQQREAEVRLPATLPNALGYAEWVEEVWLNYLSNALKYGGTPPIIHITAEADAQRAGYIRYAVRDNGAGLSQAEQGRLFQNFSRLERHSGLEGHGLGLVIVRQMVERMGGTVAVASSPGQGSAFSFSLPAVG